MKKEKRKNILPLLVLSFIICHLSFSWGQEIKRSDQIKSKVVREYHLADDVKEYIHTDVGDTAAAIRTFTQSEIGDSLDATFPINADKFDAPTLATYNRINTDLNPTTTNTAFYTSIAETDKHTILLLDSIDISGSRTVPSNVRIEFSSKGKISGGEGDTLHLANTSQIVAPYGKKIFDNVNVVFSDTTTSTAQAAWWGLFGDSSTFTDGVSINKAIQSKAKTILLPPGNFRNNSVWTLNYGQSLIGSGIDNTIIHSFTGSAHLRVNHYTVIKDLTMYGYNDQIIIAVSYKKPVYFYNVHIEKIDTVHSDTGCIDSNGGKNYFYDSQLISYAISSPDPNVYSFFQDTAYFHNTDIKGKHYIVGGGTQSRIWITGGVLEQSQTSADGGGALLNAYQSTKIYVDGGATLICNDLLTGHDPVGGQALNGDSSTVTSVSNSTIFARDYLFAQDSESIPDSFLFDNCKIYIDTARVKSGRDECGLRAASSFIGVYDSEIYYMGTQTNKDISVISGAGGSEQIFLKNVYLENGQIRVDGTGTNKLTAINVTVNNDSTNSVCNTAPLALIGGGKGTSFTGCSFIYNHSGSSSTGNAFLLRQNCDSTITFSKCNFKSTPVAMNNAFYIRNGGCIFNHCTFDMGGRIIMSGETSPTHVFLNNCIIRTDNADIITGNGIVTYAHMNGCTVNKNSFTGAQVAGGAITNTTNFYDASIKVGPGQ